MKSYIDELLKLDKDEAADKVLGDVGQLLKGQEALAGAIQRIKARLPSSPDPTLESEDSLYGYTPDGEEVRIYRPSERLSGNAGGSRGQLGLIVRDLVTGRRDYLGDEKRDASGSSSTLGGVLLETAVASEIIDLARSKTRVIQAGAFTVPMATRDIRIAKVTGNPSAGWRPEGVSLPKGDLTFGDVRLQARTLGVLVKLNIELVEDAVNLTDIVQNAFAEQLALELDRAALLGTGAAEEPLGLENTADVQTMTSVGTPSDYSKFSDATFKVQEKNGEAGAIILAPRTMNTLDKLEDTTGQPLRPPESWQTLLKLSTNQVPVNRGAGSNESLAFVGDFNNLWIGVRTSIRIEASREAADSSSSAFRDLQLWVRAYLRADVAVVRPDHFVVMSGILA